MKNFGMMVKMMVMALAMGALFCSCNSAGGYDAYEAQESKASNIELGGSGTVASRQAGPFTIIIPEISVSVSGADEAVQSETGTTAITAEASEGAQFIWYVNGMFQEGETESTYELSCAYPGVYDVTCIAYSADGALVKSASMAVTVYPR